MIAFLLLLAPPFPAERPTPDPVGAVEVPNLHLVEVYRFGNESRGFHGHGYLGTEVTVRQQPTVPGFLVGDRVIAVGSHPIRWQSDWWSGGWHRHYRPGAVVVVRVMRGRSWWPREVEVTLAARP